MKIIGVFLILASIAMIIVMRRKDVSRHFVKKFLGKKFKESFDVTKFCFETNNSQICCSERDDEYEKSGEGCFEELLDSISNLNVPHVYLFISFISAIVFTAFAIWC